MMITSLFSWVRARMFQIAVTGPGVAWLMGISLAVATASLVGGFVHLNNAAYARGYVARSAEVARATDDLNARLATSSAEVLAATAANRELNNRLALLIQGGIADAPVASPQAITVSDVQSGSAGMICEDYPPALRAKIEAIKPARTR